MFIKRVLGAVGLLLLLGLMAQPLWAHATLVRAEPAANATLAQPPTEIRLWFTEPLEPTFSRIRLRDSRGTELVTARSQVDSADALQMYLQPGDLPNGLYTVVWQVVSAADGHQTAGSFPFTIGAAPATTATTATTTTAIPTVDAEVRWFNLLSLVLLMGSVGFVYFVWQPAGVTDEPTVARWLHQVVWWGWGLVGVSSSLLLVQQTAILADLALVDALRNEALWQVLQSTRFGLLWLVRMGLWVLLGLALWPAPQRPALYAFALVLGAALLATQSLYSHAAAAQERAVAILADWVHLLLTGLWLGGLLPFVVVIGALRRVAPVVTPVISRLVGYFSNYARLCVAGLMITGLYAGWLQVGSWAALTTTRYGTVFLVKLLLILPLLLLGAVNLLITQRRLGAGQTLCVGRLRSLLGAELVLGVAVLGAVGVMTAINPARNELQQREIAAAVPIPPTPDPFTELQMVDQLHIELTISPGWVGENTFTVALSTMADNQPVTDASLIRLRFQSQSANLGESELRLTEATDGRYRVTGSNLSAPGGWQIRVTVQRPDQFDAVVDFMPTVTAPPEPEPPPVLDLTAPLPYRQHILLLTGSLALALGGYSLAQRGWRRSRVLAVGLLLLGGVFVGNGLL